MKPLVKIVFMTFISFTASSQSPTNLYWVRYFNQINFNQKWSWQSEFDGRRSIKSDNQRQFIMHAFVNVNTKSKTDLSAGITGSWVTNAKNLTVPEIRFFQSVTANLVTVKRLTVQVRFRLEERFLHLTNTEKTELVDGYHFRFRTRYRIQFQYGLDKNQKWLVRLSDEIMYHTDSDYWWKYDQNRFYAGIERKFSKGLSLEVGYLFLDAYSVDKNPQFNVVRTTLYHRINLR